MSHADLAFAVRRVSDGRLKPTEQSIRKWIRAKHVPGADAIAAIASATGRELGFFFEPDSEDDEEIDRTVRMEKIRTALASAGRDDLVADLESLAGVTR